MAAHRAETCLRQEQGFIYLTSETRRGGGNSSHTCPSSAEPCTSLNLTNIHPLCTSGMAGEVPDPQVHQGFEGAGEPEVQVCSSTAQVCPSSAQVCPSSAQVCPKHAQVCASSAQVCPSSAWCVPAGRGAAQAGGSSPGTVPAPQLCCWQPPACPLPFQGIGALGALLHGQVEGADCQTDLAFLLLLEGTIM